MKHKNKFDILENADDNIVNRLSEIPVLTEKEKKRIYNMSRRSINNMKRENTNTGTSKHNDEFTVSGVEIDKRPAGLRYFYTAAACLLAVIGIGGTVFLMKNSAQTGVNEAPPDVMSTVTATTGTSLLTTEVTGNVTETSIVSGYVASADTTSGNAEGSTENTSSQQVASVLTETTSVVTTAEITDKKNIDNSEMTAILRNLTDKNLYCMDKIYVLSMLPCDQSAPFDYDNPETYIAKCTSENFQKYNDLVEYTYSVYTDSLAEELLNSGVNSQKRYVDVDGDLYCNRYCDGGKGYYVDWENYSIVIDELTDDYCNFTLYTTVTWPALEPVAEEYIVTGMAVLEDGEWVLTKMLS